MTAADRHWAHIATGSTFESLVTTLLFFEDPRASLFGRRGKDGGQDALAGDRQTVFQAKHHESGSASKAIADAKKEAAKIANYRQAGHARYEQWKDIKRWRLVTNCRFNPTDNQTWTDEVVPLFAKLGLEAEYWSSTNLDALLAKNPEVDRAYFRNETRALLTLPEALARIEDEQLFSRAWLPNFVGRAAELQVVSEFIASSDLFLVVYGIGGIGKTRFLLEAGERISETADWQVLWANNATMEASAAWFDAVVPERKSVLLVDEPENEKLLRLLSEQLGGRVGRAQRWKIIVCVRSTKDPVIRFLSAQRMQARVRWLPLGDLAAVDAVAFCEHLLSRSFPDAPAEWRATVGKTLLERFGKHPIWLMLAVQELEARGDLAKVPNNAAGLADEYLREATAADERATSPELLALVRWLSLLGTVNRENDEAIDLLGKAAGTGDAETTRTFISLLVRRRVVVERGANRRLVEIKPDVFRDHVLTSWLTNDPHGGRARAASADAKAIVEKIGGDVVKGNVEHFHRSVLESLARTELIMRYAEQPVGLLDDLFRLLDQKFDGMVAHERVTLAEALVSVAPIRPTDFLRLGRRMRESPVATEEVVGLIRTQTVGQTDVVLKLAWLAYHCALGAEEERDQREILQELCALSSEEARIQKSGSVLPNDGKRAAQLLGQAIVGGPQFRASFETAAQALTGEVLSSLSKSAPGETETTIVDALVLPTLRVERHQTWSDGDKLHVRMFNISASSDAWKARTALLDRIKTLLADASVPVSSRVLLWHVFSKAHQETNYASDRIDGAEPNSVRALLLSDLGFARDALRKTSAGAEELKAARELWDWHRRFGDDKETKNIAAQLETLYLGDSLAAEFDPLVDMTAWPQTKDAIAEKADAIAAQKSAEAISAFVDRGLRFFGSRKEMSRILIVGSQLGRHALAIEEIRAFARSAGVEEADTPHREFGMEILRSWLYLLRQNDLPQVDAIIGELLGSCRSDQRRLDLIEAIYGTAPQQLQLSTAEHSRLRGLLPLFISLGRPVSFIRVAGWTISYDWPALRPLLEQCLDSFKLADVHAGLVTLVDGVYWAVRDKTKDAAPDGISEWLLNQLMRLPDVDRLDGNLDWSISEILKMELAGFRGECSAGEASLHDS